MNKLIFATTFRLLCVAKKDHLANEHTEDTTKVLEEIAKLLEGKCADQMMVLLAFALEMVTDIAIRGDIKDVKEGKERGETHRHIGKVDIEERGDWRWN